MKTFNNFTDIKFIYLSNRPALSCTDLKKTMKSSLILWMMQQKKWRRNLSNGEVIHAEVWLCQFGYYCDVLVVSCLCGLQFMCEIREHVRHETVKERTFGMLETNASIDCNAASVRAALMNYFVWLNWTLPTVNCDFFSKSVCVLHCFLWSNCNTSFKLPAFIIGKLSKDLCKCNVKQCMKLYF